MFIFIKKRLFVVLGGLIIFILGIPSIVYASNNYSLKRIYGNSRYETSMKICDEFSTNQVNNIIVVNGNNFPDALAGSMLSKKLNAPILLVDSTDNNNSVDYIKAHLNKSGNIYILGGGASVSEEYENYIKSLGYNTKRFGGTNRFDTNKIIVDNLNVKKGTPIVLVNGYGFADALSVSSIAASKGYPIIMSNSGKLPSEIEGTLKNIAPSKVFIIGGEGSIEDSISDELKEIIPSLSDNNIIRIQGTDRYETSLNVCKYFNLASDTVIISNGENFADALSGSALAAKVGAPIMLTDGFNILNQKNYIDESSYSKLILLGGVGAISAVSEDILKGNIDINKSLSFPDANLEMAIRDVVGKESGDILMKDVLKITELNLHNKQIKDISGIENLLNLNKLVLSNNGITDISPLSALVNLRYLDIGNINHGYLNYNDIIDLTPLKPLTNLEVLHAYCLVNLQDLEPISSLKNLKELDLVGAFKLRNIAPISNLTRLQTLDLAGDTIEDITPLKSLINLKELGLELVVIDSNKLAELRNSLPSCKIKQHF